MNEPTSGVQMRLLRDTTCLLCVVVGLVCFSGAGGAVLGELGTQVQSLDEADNCTYDVANSHASINNGDPLIIGGPTGGVTVSLSDPDTGEQVYTASYSDAITAIEGSCGSGAVPFTLPDTISPGQYTLTVSKLASSPTESSESVQSRVTVTEKQTDPPTARINLQYETPLLAGDTVTLDATESTPGSADSITSYEWVVTSSVTNTVQTRTGEEALLTLPGLQAPQVPRLRPPDEYISNPLAGYEIGVRLTITTTNGRTDKTQKSLNISVDNLGEVVADPESGLPTIDDGYRHSNATGQYYNPSYRVLHSNLPNPRKGESGPTDTLFDAYEQTAGTPPANPFALPPLLPTYPLAALDIVPYGDDGTSKFGFRRLDTDSDPGNPLNREYQYFRSDPYVTSLKTDNIAGNLQFFDQPIPTYNRTYWSENTTPESLAELSPYTADAPKNGAPIDVQRGRTAALGSQWLENEAAVVFPNFRGQPGNVSLNNSGVVRDVNVSYLGGIDVINPQFQLNKSQDTESLPQLVSNQSEFIFHPDYRLDPRKLPRDKCHSTAKVGRGYTTQLTCTIYDIGDVSVNRSVTLVDESGDRLSRTDIQAESLADGRTVQPAGLQALSGVGTVGYNMSVTAAIDEHEFVLNRTQFEFTVDVSGPDSAGVQWSPHWSSQTEQTGPDTTVTQTYPSETRVTLDASGPAPFEQWSVYANGKLIKTSQSRAITVPVEQDITVNAKFNQSRSTGTSLDQSQSLPGTGTDTKMSSASSTHSTQSQTQVSNGTRDTTQPTPRSVSINLPVEVDKANNFWQLTDTVRTEGYETDTTSNRGTVRVANMDNALRDTEFTQVVIEQPTEAGGQINDVLLEINRPGYDADTQTQLGTDEFIKQTLFSAFELNLTQGVAPVEDNSGTSVATVDLPWSLTTIDRYSTGTLREVTPNVTRDTNWRELSMMTATRPGDWANKSTYLNPNETDWFYQALLEADTEGLPDHDETIPPLDAVGDEFLAWANASTLEGSQFRTLTDVPLPQVLDTILFYGETDPTVEKSSQTKRLRQTAFAGEPVAQNLTDGVRLDPAPLTYGGHTTTPLAADPETVPLDASPHINGTVDATADFPQLLDSVLIENTIGEFTRVKTVFGDTVTPPIDTHRLTAVTPEVTSSFTSGTATIQLTNPNTGDPIHGRTLTVLGAEKSVVTTNETGHAQVSPAANFVQFEFTGDSKTNPCEQAQTYDTCTFADPVVITLTTGDTAQIVQTIFRLFFAGLIAFPLYLGYQIFSRFN